LISWFLVAVQQGQKLPAVAHSPMESSAELPIDAEEKTGVVTTDHVWQVTTTKKTTRTRHNDSKSENASPCWKEGRDDGQEMT
jgi:hypothetical protein